MRVLTIASVLLLAACGGSGTPSGGTNYTSTFAIQGAPHGGAYAQCDTSADVGGVATLTCTGLVSGCSAADCTLAVVIPTSGSGSYSCAKGQASVQITDPGLPDNGTGVHSSDASCPGAASGMITAAPQPDCPTNQDGCNTAIGDCTISVASLTSSGANAPFGHFSGSISATLYTGDQITQNCNTTMQTQWTPVGSPMSVTINGGW
jgi:hypothetical protein